MPDPGWRDRAVQNVAFDDALDDFMDEQDANGGTAWDHLPEYSEGEEE